jgi:uncharacterized protein (TIGR02391 family)
VEFRYQDLQNLREKLTSTQKDILDHIWSFFKEKGEYIPTRVLHHGFSKQNVLAVGESLGGDVFYENHENGKYRYAITLLGILIGDQGLAAEKLLTRFFEHLQKIYKENPEVEYIRDKEIESALALSPANVNELRHLLQIANLMSMTAQHDWTARVPEDIDEFPDITDFREYICIHRIHDYDPKRPFSYQLRTQYWANQEIEAKKRFFGGQDNGFDAATRQESDIEISHPKQQFEFETLLHPTIARNAYGLFMNGHLREAVLNSVVSIFDSIRERTGLHEDGDKLIGKAFSIENPYLVLSELHTDSGQNDQRGFMQIFKGAFQGIRNPKAHSLVHDLTELKAAQYLVFASLLARRVEEATLVMREGETK